MAGALNFWPIWIAGSLGAALGDWLSYWIGRKLEYRVQHIWPLSRHPDLIPKGEAFVKKWGVLGIFIGRFFGPLRASVPLVAGIFEMPFWRFQIANFSVGLRLGGGAAHRSATSLRHARSSAGADGAASRRLTRRICGSSRRRCWNSRRSTPIACGSGSAAASQYSDLADRAEIVVCCAPPPRPCRRRCNRRRPR